MLNYNKLALEAAKKSPCQKRKVGAVVVDINGLDHQEGYNYNPTGEACEIAPGITADEVVHAEVMAIQMAEKLGIKPSEIYVTHPPCSACEEAIKEAGITKVHLVEEFMKFDDGKLRYDLIPTSSTLALARVLSHGAKKYKPNNWRAGSIERYVAAAFRHFEAYRSGEFFDQDSGLPHLEHLLTNIAFLIELDDSRPKDST